MPHGVHKTPQTNVRFPPDVRLALSTRAEAEGVTVTDLVIRAVRDLLAQPAGTTESR